jgi:hypothetical protein
MSGRQHFKTKSQAHISQHFKFTYFGVETSDCAVARLWVEVSGIWIPVEARDFPLLHSFQIRSGIHSKLLFQWVSKFRSPTVKWPVSESDHTLLSSAKVKNEWNHTSPPSIRLHGVKRDKFTFNYFTYTTCVCVCVTSNKTSSLKFCYVI